MTTENHTPGPWKWDRVPLPGISSTAVAEVLNPVDEHGRPCGSAILRHDANGQTPWVPTEADKSLIAACPELLEELSLIVEGWEKKGRGLTPWESERLNFARIAIAKADGQEVKS